jgi:hypothetical protein
MLTLSNGGCVLVGRLKLLLGVFEPCVREGAVWGVCGRVGIVVMMTVLDARAGATTTTNLGCLMRERGG